MLVLGRDVASIKRNVSSPTLVVDVAFEMDDKVDEVEEAVTEIVEVVALEEVDHPMEAEQLDTNFPPIAFRTYLAQLKTHGTVIDARTRSRHRVNQTEHEQPNPRGGRVPRDGRQGRRGGRGGDGNRGGRSTQGG